MADSLQETAKGSVESLRSHHGPYAARSVDVGVCLCLDMALVLSGRLAATLRGRRARAAGLQSPREPEARCLGLFFETCRVFKVRERASPSKRHYTAE